MWSIIVGYAAGGATLYRGGAVQARGLRAYRRGWACGQLNLRALIGCAESTDRRAEFRRPGARRLVRRLGADVTSLRILFAAVEG